MQTSTSVIKPMTVINFVKIQKVHSSVAAMWGLFLLGMERTVLVSTTIIIFLKITMYAC